jgi:hypothetical protein
MYTCSFIISSFLLSSLLNMHYEIGSHLPLSISLVHFIYCLLLTDNISQHVLSVMSLTHPIEYTKQRSCLDFFPSEKVYLLYLKRSTYLWLHSLKKKLSIYKRSP